MNVSDRLTRLTRQQRRSEREARAFALVGAERAARYWSRRAASQQRRIDILLAPIARHSAEDTGA